MVLSPLGGRISDRVGHLGAVGLGMLVLGLAMVALTLVDTGPALMAPAVLAGLGQALVSPASLALVSARLPEGSMGMGMGMVGAMRNGGKVAGPVLAGILIHLIDFESTFRLIGTALLSGGALVWLCAQGWRGAAPQDKMAAASSDRPDSTVFGAS